MDPFMISLCTGAVAGVLDVLPMVARKLPFRSCLSAFLTYLFAAVLIFHSNLPYLPWWADGMAVTLMLAIPVLLTFTGKERRAIPFILVNALVLGFLIRLSERLLA